MQRNQPLITYDLRKPSDVASSGALLEATQEYFGGAELPYIQQLNHAVALQQHQSVITLFLQFIKTLRNTKLFQKKIFWAGGVEDPTWLIGVDHEALIQFSIADDVIDIKITGKDQKTVEQYIKDFSQRLDKIDLIPSSDELTLQIYYFDSSEGVSFFRTKIVMPTWADIADNYVGITRKALDRLFAGDVIKGTGLMIWSGEPGTGKTYAIRALMQQWKQDYRCVSVSDFDTFLEQPAYYYSIADYDKRPALIILEDAGESLLKEGRGKYSGRISKLLNLTDGLLSQGREDLFLITFNENIKELDSATTRPGRCLSRITFDCFSSKEAGVWLKDHDVAEDVIRACLKDKASKSLAELYQIYSGEELSTYSGHGEVGF